MASLLEDLLKPVSDTSFCGEDGSYDPDFELARGEADKSSENNFNQMEEASRRFLIAKSKDMRALGYLTWSSAINNGADAFAECIIGYCKLVMEHWDDIHPKRPTARSNALKWLNGERVLGLLADISIHGSYEFLLSASGELAKLTAFCDQKFPEGAPSFLGFTKFVKELAEKNKPKPIEEQSESSVATNQAVASGPGVLGSADDCIIAIQNAAFFLIEENRTNPFPYRLIRMLKWDPILAAPPATGGKTTIPAPNPGAVEAYQSMFQGEAWADIAKNGEDAFAGDSMIFWFDIQRYIVSALIGLGGDYLACAKAIRIELALLLARAPALADLAFDDGIPFADAMTKEWIQTEVLTALGGGGGGAAPIKKKGDVGEEQKQASLLLGEGKLDQALNILRTGVANDSNEKNNFDRKLIMAELCYKGNKANISKALIDDLLGDIENYSLRKWDTELCVSVYHLAQKVYLSLSDSAEEGLKHIFREKALAMHAQISKLDPVLALAADIK
jgi:type VI secretion system protein VasJ